MTRRSNAISGEDIMKRACAALAAICFVAITGRISTAPAQSGWVPLFDGKSLEGWNQTGDVNWRVVDGAIVADKGTLGYLVSKNSYKDFEIRAEFWVDANTNTGIYFRCSKPEAVAPDNAYEAN